MKRIFGAFMAVLFLAQCSEQSAEQKETNTISEDIEIKLLSEELKPYALSPIDSVYSLAIKLSSSDSALVQYNVTLIQGTETFKDSLVFNIPAGEEIAGEFIFPACRVKNNPKPSFTSKIKQVYDR
jgi:hypothetical protein